MDALEQYLDHVDALIAKLSPAQQRQLAKQIGDEIRKRNAQRIRTNIEPDGSAMAPRQGRNLRKLRGGLRQRQQFYYLGRMVSLQWSKDAGDRIIGRDGNNDPFKAGGYLKQFIMLQSSARRTMFRRLPLVKWLKTKATADSATVGFWNGGVGKLAAAHQSGEGKTAARQLLGFAPDDIQFIEHKAIEFLAENL